MLLLQPSGRVRLAVTRLLLLASCVLVLLAATGAPAHAAATADVPAGASLEAIHSDPNEGGPAGFHFGVAFIAFALVLVAGALGSAIERLGQPAVIGQLLAGIALSALAYLGWDFVEQVRGSELIAFVASFGVLLLLFSIGLESDLREMRRVGVNALLVALIGVALPFAFGTLLLPPLFFPDSGSGTRLFIGAALVATSVGITASVFRSFGATRTRAAQTVLGAAVIDDVLGLIVLATVSAIVSGGAADISTVLELTLTSFGFLGGAIVVGMVAARPLSRLFSLVDNGIGMKLAFAIGFALAFGYVAELMGLEPIIGAFAAGLVLDKVHFRVFTDAEILYDLRDLELSRVDERSRVSALVSKHRDLHIEELVRVVGLVFVPAFFVFTGLQIDFASLLRPELYFAAVVVSLFAILGKVAAGVAAKGPFGERLFVGVAMVPRGEVGLIFAATGKALGVLDAQAFSLIVLVVVITTFVSPPLIKRLAPDATAPAGRPSDLPTPVAPGGARAQAPSRPGS
jgi:Kef-type K+ transport system membrane component KefB